MTQFKRTSSIFSISNCILLAVFMFPITFMTVRHGVHVSLFALLLIVLIVFFQNKQAHFHFKNKTDLIIVLSFCGLIIAVLLGQLLRSKMHMAAFDGPSRIAFAGLIYLLLKNRQIAYIKTLDAAIPVGLLCVLTAVSLNPGAYWDGRLATYFVDPNTLGSQTFILALIVFLSIAPSPGESRWLLLLKLVGGAAGIYVSIYSGSRGAWLAGPFIFLLFLLIRFGDFYRAQGAERFRIALQTSLIVIAAIFLFFLAFYFSDAVSSRVIGGYHEIRNWLMNTKLDTSAGIRLSIWKFSFQFASESLLFGYGEEKNMMQLLSNSPLNIPANEIAISTMAATGPHSDILSKLLSSGLFGLLAYLCLLFSPFYFFYTHQNSLIANKRRAARMGMYYITGVFIAGLSNEQLSLKYLCTFYGLMTATLLAQVLQASSMGSSQSFTHPSAKVNEAPRHG
ncbi:O-antigen ligase family protein [Polynucleobacter sp. UK-FUSCHL-C3]|uniref:O-antigen ligase family protein n=1 Tax=Polynucleobacter sp. UK-FUSCHL-C3 TaxID=2955208 RepID=A0AAU8A3K1_9BURK